MVSKWGRQCLVIHQDLHRQWVASPVSCIASELHRQWVALPVSCIASELHCQWVALPVSCSHAVTSHWVFLIHPFPSNNICNFQYLLLTCRFIHASLLSGLGKLRVLNLSHNKLTAISADLFGSTYSLELLDLSYNAITALPAHSLVPLQKLRLLWLSHNIITVLYFVLHSYNFCPTLDGVTNCNWRYAVEDWERSSYLYQYTCHRCLLQPSHTRWELLRGWPALCSAEQGDTQSNR